MHGYIPVNFDIGVHIDLRWSRECINGIRVGRPLLGGASFEIAIGEMGAYVKIWIVVMQLICAGAMYAQDTELNYQVFNKNENAIFTIPQLRFELGHMGTRTILDDAFDRVFCNNLIMDNLDFNHFFKYGNYREPRCAVDISYEETGRFFKVEIKQGDTVVRSRFEIRSYKSKKSTLVDVYIVRVERCLKRDVDGDIRSGVILDSRRKLMSYQIQRWKLFTIAQISFAILADFSTIDILYQ